MNEQEKVDLITKLIAIAKVVYSPQSTTRKSHRAFDKGGKIVKKLATRQEGIEALEDVLKKKTLRLMLCTSSQVHVYIMEYTPN